MTSMNEQRTVVIAKPGYDTIRLGPLPAHTADSWAASLNIRLHQAPEGTDVQVTTFNPEAGPHIDPGSIPRTIEELAGPYRDDPGHPANGGFPDLYDRLVLVHGETRAAQMWTHAGNQIGAEAAYGEAEEATLADLAEAADLLDQAQQLTAQAAQKITRAHATAREWDHDVLPSTSSRDGERHADKAGRELRAAVRALREEPS